MFPTLRPASVLSILLFAVLPTAQATEYHVGPDQALKQLGQVPWFRLHGGDTVFIHYRAEPYREKILISSRGSAAKWIRILGVPGPGGELPVISGDNATTSKNMHYRWPDPTGDRAIQWSGIIQIARREGEDAPKPGYIEIAQLRVQDGYSAFSFTAENGTPAKYGDFCSCIYARSAEHILIRANVLTNCGLGFYNWTGSDPGDLQADTVIRGNWFSGNGISGQYSEHALYTESDGVIIEHNRFDVMRPGSLGSQIKDRSAGTVVRYNHIVQPEGWMVDLVEPEGGYPTIAERPTYKESWVYGNVMVSFGKGGALGVHWNEDHNQGRGRADLGGRLFFYNNTMVVRRDEPEIWKFPVFSVHNGGWDCAASTKGVIDVRNNIFANLPRTSRKTALMFFAGCGTENFDFGKNWVSPGWKLEFYKAYTGKADGTQQFVSPADNNPGFARLPEQDVRLAPDASAARVAGPLAPQVLQNTLGLDLSPTMEYSPDGHGLPRSSGTAVGAFAAGLAGRGAAK